MGAAVGLFSVAQAAEVPDHQLKEWKIGKVISGEDYKMKDLEGKVVVIEEWGVH